MSHPPLKEFSLVVLLAVFYLTTAYFAVEALAPAYSLQASFIAAIIATTVYFFWVILQREQEGIWVFLLFATPLVCVAAGVLWWILRLLNLWEPIR